MRPASRFSTGAIKRYPRRGAVEDYHSSAGAVEHRDVASKLLRFDGNGVELGAHAREQVGRRGRLLRVARCGGAEQCRGKEVRQNS
jgi:hypothetical protein